MGHAETFGQKFNDQKFNDQNSISTCRCWAPESLNYCLRRLNTYTLKTENGMCPKHCAKIDFPKLNTGNIWRSVTPLHLPGTSKSNS